MSNAKETTEIVINILTALSKALQETAEDMQAGTPTAKSPIETPETPAEKALKAVIEKHIPATTKAPIETPETPEVTGEVTLKTLRPLALAKVEAGKKAEVQAAIKKYTPSGKLTLVKEEDYVSLFTELEGI
jgi:hypothetical protein